MAPLDFDARILRDSISPDKHRLTTFQATFPRFILAEFNTHRVLSRNSASSRAIPTERIISATISDPFVPETFNQRVKGMGVGKAHTGPKAWAARQLWLGARWCSVGAAYGLMKLDVDKSRVNRLLEPFMWHTVIATGTEWSNFFALRTHEDAQPEFRKVATMMRELYEGHVPTKLDYNQWHLPLVSDHEIVELGLAGYSTDQIKDISVGRCARVSYLTHDGKRDVQADIDLARTRLAPRGHMSPFEHVACPIHPGHYNGWSGNFQGWFQYRKDIAYESDYSLVAA